MYCMMKITIVIFHLGCDLTQGCYISHFRQLDILVMVYQVMLDHVILALVTKGSLYKGIGCMVSIL